MSEFDYDLFTIGAGSGGVRAARMAAGGYLSDLGIFVGPEEIGAAARRKLSASRWVLGR